MSLKKIILGATAIFMLTAGAIMYGHYERCRQVERHSRINSFLVGVLSAYSAFYQSAHGAGYPTNREEFLRTQEASHPFLFRARKDIYANLIYIPDVQENTITALSRKVYFKNNSFLRVKNEEVGVAGISHYKLLLGAPAYVYVNSTDGLCHIYFQAMPHDIGVYGGTVEELARELSGIITAP